MWATHGLCLLIFVLFTLQFNHKFKKRSCCSWLGVCDTHLIPVCQSYKMFTVNVKWLNKHIMFLLCLCIKIICTNVFCWRSIKILVMGCRHSSVDSSVPSILPPRFESQAHHLCFFTIYIVQIVYLSFELGSEKNENNQKVAGIGQLKKYCWSERKTTYSTILFSVENLWWQRMPLSVFLFALLSHVIAIFFHPRTDRWN